MFFSSRVLKGKSKLASLVGDFMLVFWGVFGCFVMVFERVFLFFVNFW